MDRLESEKGKEPFPASQIRGFLLAYFSALVFRIDMLRAYVIIELP